MNVIVSNLSFTYSLTIISPPISSCISLSHAYFIALLTHKSSHLTNKPPINNKLHSPMLIPLFTERNLPFTTSK